MNVSFQLYLVHRISNRVPYSELWVGCFSHQLNTSMKAAFDSVQDENICLNVDKFKQLIRLLKKNGFNEKLPPRKRLQQEVATHFGNTEDMVKLFLDTEQDVSRIIDASDQDSAKIVI